MRTMSCVKETLQLLTFGSDLEYIHPPAQLQFMLL